MDPSLALAKRNMLCYFRDRESVFFSLMGITFLVGNLTWEGYDFLEKIRQDTVWNRTKDLITQKGLPMALEVVKDVSSTIIGKDKSCHFIG